MIKIAIKSLILPVFLAPLLLQAKPDHFAKKVKSTRSVTKQDMYHFGRSIVQFPWFIATLAHELGHAITAKILTGAPVDIHLGAQPEIDEANKKLLKKGGLTVHTFKGGGYSNLGLPEKNQQLPILVAGPAMGILSLAGMRVILNTVQEPIYMTPYKAFLLGLIDSKILFQALSGFTPIYNKTADGDGSMIWHLMGADEKTIKNVSSIDRKGRLLKLPYLWHTLAGISKILS
ncbi:MAG TPA: hypothetical protein VFF04_01115 [Candidatus Babeliales bacterium]|nr:hypothetical protein [Candidatus Babeliales bacterium]